MFMETGLIQPFASAAAGFSRYLRDVRGRSLATAQAYTRDVEAYLAFLQRAGRDLSDGLSSVQAGLYLMERMAPARTGGDALPQITPRSAARAISALKAFAAYLVFDGELEANPLEHLQPPKYGVKLPVYYTVEEMQRLMSACDGQDNVKGWRDAAVLHVLYGGGLRVSECAGLDLGSINLAEGWANVLGKGGKQRVVPLGRRVVVRVQRWLERGRPAWAGPASGPALFIGRQGKRIARRVIQHLLDRLALEAGMLKPVSPHKLRHACATHLLEGGADVRIVQELLGHEKLGTTQVYTQVTRTHLRDVYLQAHPRAKLPPGEE